MADGGKRSAKITWQGLIAVIDGRELCVARTNISSDGRHQWFSSFAARKGKGWFRSREDALSAAAKIMGFELC